ncbi:hypothetical protein EUX98_g820 [Antrodiella citrinella]|uniref:Stress response protein NST1 n=1 Tax=Antrodiella citrinella TaxID=2447956 RepID=A0A4S4NBK2_9APHY|nr:hypothetical protein EUX98_g820 [Antrodiella citrinella]
MPAPKKKLSAAGKAPVKRTPVSTAPLPTPAPAAFPATNGKKKKKKGKGKAVADYDEDEDEEDMPPLEPLNGSAQHHRRSGSRTGLSPELESVHLSTTASLSASTRLNHNAIAEAELLATADHLARSMDGSDPDGGGGVGIGVNSEYWASFPEHLRNFVRNTYSQLSSPGNEDEKTQAMYAIAQQIHAGVGLNLNAHSKGQTTTRYSSTTTYPFDPSIFTDPAFQQAMEQAAAANGLQPFRASDARFAEAATAANMLLVNDYGGDEQEYAEDDYFSDEDGDEDDDRPRTASFTLETHIQADGHQVQYVNGHATVTTATSKKKNKKKKRKGNGDDGDRTATPPLPAGYGGYPATALPVTPGAPRNLSHLPPPDSVANTRMTAPRPPPTTNPLQSSRAAGKQPMSYTTAAPANPATPTSRRAASKAPAASQTYQHNHPHHHPSPPSSNTSAAYKSRPPANGNAPTQPAKSSNKIWSTSTSEERERIKEFWLGLGEEERRSLVKIEKEAVLRKMKEQQKHSCMCAVCGRKRNAIEEELEVLYDAYYEELEQYANYQQRYISSGGSLPPPQGPGPFPGSVELDKNGAVISPHTLANPTSRGKNGIVNGRKTAKQTPQAESEFEEEEDDEYEEEEEYEDEEEDEEDEEEEDDGDPEDDPPADQQTAPLGNRRRAATNGKPPPRDGLMNFGNSLTVTGAGNILTVADDLLKNDGQKFLEMMEQLAERRMQREEEAAASVEEDSEDEEEDLDEEDEEEDEDEEDEEDEEEEEVMTEEQKMEEGKRMFSIFAARMFEQRVLQAYREKVAQARQLQLLRELEDEQEQSKEKEAKKLNQAAKKKEKKKQQKMAKDTEKAARAAEKAAEEATIKAKQLAQEEENRKRREEDRARREAQRKAQEEDRLRKEEERRKRQAEEKERQAELDRKRKEKEDKAKADRKEREERERKVREEREAKEKAEKAAAAATRREREQQEKEERERKLAKEKEEKEKADKERAEKEKAEKEARERQQQQQQQQRAAARAARAPTSPRNASASGSTTRSPGTITPSKKNPSKPAAIALQPPTMPQPTRAPIPLVRPSVVTQSQPATPVIPQMPAHFGQAPSTPMYSPIAGINASSAMSPRLNFAPAGPYTGNFVAGSSMPSGPPPLAPSALPRTFGANGPFEPAFGRNTTPLAPIAPPSKILQHSNSLPSPTQAITGGRRASVNDPGPITRPVAPIARPAGDSGSGSTSPSRRSPSPKGFLGSSALAADDDEVIPSQPRRVVAPGAAVGWGASSPRSNGPDMRVPWGPAAPPPGVSPRLPWGASAPGPGPEWHPSPPFFGGPFSNHNSSPPPPHTGS